MSCPPIAADLHTHTFFSDGELSPEQLVEAACARGLRALAITDHDSVAGIPRAVEHAKSRGLAIVPGCELTAYEGRIELHILALYIDVAPGSAFDLLLSKMQHARRERALRMAEQLRAAGIAVEDAEILEAAGSAQSIGRPHVAAALIKRGHARSAQEAFLKFLQDGRPGYVPKLRLSPEEAFAAVHASGGVAILAHPGSNPHDELIAPLFRRGMDGVEAHYNTHSPLNRRFYAGLARRYEKLVSGGSDFHGPRVRPGTNVGDAGVDAAALEALRRTSRFRNS